MDQLSSLNIRPEQGISTFAQGMFVQTFSLFFCTWLNLLFIFYLIKFSNETRPDRIIFPGGTTGGITGGTTGGITGGIAGGTAGATLYPT